MASIYNTDEETEDILFIDNFLGSINQISLHLGNEQVVMCEDKMILNAVTGFLQALVYDIRETIVLGDYVQHKNDINFSQSWIVIYSLFRVLLFSKGEVKLGQS
jgi:hypothetical protein